MDHYIACVLSIILATTSINAELGLYLTYCSPQQSVTSNNQDDEVNAKTRKLVQHCRNCEWKEALEVLRLLKPDELDQYWFQLENLLVLNECFDEADAVVEAHALGGIDATIHCALARWYLPKPDARSEEKCFNHISKCMEIEPDKLSIRIAIELAVRRQNVKFACECLEKLFRRHPVYLSGYARDLGLTSQESDIAHGQEQLKNLCHDRPKLGEMITTSPKLAEWIVNRFSGIFVGKRLYWSSSPLKNCINSCSIDTKSNYQIYVEPELASEKQLSLLVHELFCAENASETFELFAAGGGGAMEKDEFLVRLLKLDHRATLKQRAFYIIEHGPLELQLPDNLTDWSLSTPDDFELFFESNLNSDAVKRYSEKFDLLRK